MRQPAEIVRHAIVTFCREFIEAPYLCYTEHGQHALFFTVLYNLLPPERRYSIWRNHQLCNIQKEYPTAGKLGKPQRQHWDVALLKTPLESIREDGAGSYDYLKLAAVVEFGLNEAADHLQDDIDRLCHPEANVEQGFVVHLYRLSAANNRLSGRDWSPKAKRILRLEEAQAITEGRSVELFYGLYDQTDHLENGIWCIKDGHASQI